MLFWNFQKQRKVVTILTSNRIEAPHYRLKRFYNTFFCFNNTAYIESLSSLNGRTGSSFPVRPFRLRNQRFEI